MACAIWGGKYYFNIFQRIVWHIEQQDFSVFCHSLAIQLIQLHRKLLEVPEVIHELEFSVYLVGSFFLHFLTFKRQIKSHLPFAGIITSSPYSTGFQDKG